MERAGLKTTLRDQILDAIWSNGWGAAEWNNTDCPYTRADYVREWWQGFHDYEDCVRKYGEDCKG